MGVHVCAKSRRAESLPVIYSMCTSAGEGDGEGNWRGDGAGQWTDDHGPGDGETDNQTDTKADPQYRQRTIKCTPCWTDLLMWQAVWLTFGARFIQIRRRIVVTIVSGSECVGLFYNFYQFCLVFCFFFFIPAALKKKKNSHKTKTWAGSQTT